MEKTEAYIDLEIVVGFSIQEAKPAKWNEEGNPEGVAIETIWIGKHELSQEAFNEIMARCQDVIEEACQEELENREDF